MNACKLTATLFLASAIALPAAADDVYYDTARVLAVTPQLERINSPRQECHVEYSNAPAYNSAERDIGGSIIGGIAGGLLGSQVGRGKGRIVGAAVGAATGAIVGDRIDNSDRHDSGYGSRPVERCVMVDNWQTVSRGYLVTYRINGRDYTTSMPNDPGPFVSVRVAVAPEANRNMVAYAPAYTQRGHEEHRGWDRRDRDNEHGHERWND